jgi:DNA-binding beta-propeller fold protein YncE
MRRLDIKLGIRLGVLLGALTLWAAPAQAGVVHVFGGYFGSEGSGPGQLKEPRGVAVNDTTHDVYVVDRGNNRVQEFNSTGTAVLAEFNGSAAPTGAFEQPSWIAVDNSGNPLDPSKEDVYVVDEGHNVIDKFTAEGTYVGQLTGTPSGAFITEGGKALNVAVDPRGVLWVLQSQTGEVDSFSDAAANEYQSRRTLEQRPYEQGFAVDAKDNIYSVGDAYINGQYRFVVIKVSSSGEVLVRSIDDEEAAGGGPLGAVVDPVGEELYTDDLSSTIGAFTLGGVRLERFGAGHLTPGSGLRGIAVDASNATVYAADSPAGRVAIFDGVRLPTVTIGALSEQQPESVTLNGSVNPEGTLVSSCVFEYDTRPYESESEGSHGESAPCTPSPGSGMSAVAVSAHVSGLSAERAYYFRLVASSGFGTSRAPGQEFFTGPRLGGEFVSGVSSSSVTLQARVDPNGADTQYYFEFGASTSYGLDVPVAPPGVDIGSASGIRSLSVHLQGLQPGSEYHYRLVVMQAGKVFEGSDHVFTTQPLVGGEPGLLDGRAWELVSPADKGGALIEPFESMPLQAAADGSGVTYGSFGPIGENVPAGRTLRAQILSTRTPAGWSTQDIDPPHALAATSEVAGEGFEYRLFSPNLALAVIEQRANVKVVLSPQAAAQGNPLYLRDNNQGTYQPLLTGGDVQPESGQPSQVEFYAATPDLAHVILGSPLALTPEAPENWFPKDGGAVLAANLYESSATAGLQLVNLLPDGHPETDAGLGAYLAGEGSGHYESALRAVSSDGRWVAWTAGQPYTGTNDGLYVRDMVEGQTLKVGGANAFYQTMSSDGSLVFFIEGGELYVFETATGIQTDLTAGHGPGATSGLVREDLLGISEDGSYVYFVAGGVLAGSSGAVSGQDNVYVMHDEGGVWSTRYITTLSGEDERDWYVKGGFGGVVLGSVRSRVSPDGRFLTFMSDRSLTGYDNLDVNSGKPDEEVYLYHAPADPGTEAGGLFCASCNPTGARPDGLLDTGQNVPLDTFSNGGNWTDRWLAGILPGWNSAFAGLTGYQPRYLSNSGRLFFESPDGLVPRATNGRWDVYEFEPAGVGTCTAVMAGYSSRSGGCVGLISGGTSSADSTFLDASENGEDVFFTTSSRLVGRDYDTAPDVYDAHVCSSASPCLQEPVLAAPCGEGEACKGAPPAQPLLFGAPPSATFNGQGNVIPSSAPVVKKKTVKCSRGKKFTHGRCVKPKSKRHKAKKAKRASHGGRAKS